TIVKHFVRYLSITFRLYLRSELSKFLIFVVCGIESREKKTNCNDIVRATMHARKVIDLSSRTVQKKKNNLKIVNVKTAGRRSKSNRENDTAAYRVADRIETIRDCYSPITRESARSREHRPLRSDWGGYLKGCRRCRPDAVIAVCRRRYRTPHLNPHTLAAHTGALLHFIANYIRRALQVAAATSVYS
ncbi:hypothetical protein AGLY_008522, partial [Aphis glycines]